MSGRLVVALLALAALLAGGAYAWREPVTTLLLVANAPDLLDPPARRAVDLAYGTDPAQRLDVYGPPPGAALRPVVVFVHGGRWQSGDKSEYRFIARTLNDAGAVAVLPNYRLYPAVRMHAAVHDVGLAVAYVQAHAREWGGDPARVVVMGHSAGAQLTALAALDTRWFSGTGATPVQGLIGLAGPYDFLPLTDDDLRDYFGPPNEYPASQPINFVTTRAPPAFLVQGTDDDSVKPHNTKNLSRALKVAGVPVETHLVAGEGHFSILKRFVAPWRGSDAVIAALRRFVGAVPSAGLGASVPPARGPLDVATTVAP
jgi:acetyl esterase/lipase